MCFQQQGETPRQQQKSSAVGQASWGLRYCCCQRDVADVAAGVVAAASASVSALASAAVSVTANAAAVTANVITAAVAGATASAFAFFLQFVLVTRAARDATRIHLSRT